MKDLAPHRSVEIFHLERIASLLDSPRGYGIRLEFLDVDMTKEEQLAFIAERDSMLDQIGRDVRLVLSRLEKSKHSPSETGIRRVRPWNPLYEVSRSSPMHECRGCGELFLIDLMTSPVRHSIGDNAVRCPSCGKFQRFDPLATGIG